MPRRAAPGGVLRWAFRTEYQTPDGEALRDDENFCYVAAWEYKGEDKAPELHTEPLSFESVKLAVRSYK